MPLAYLLNDDALKTKASEWIEWTLASARNSGAFGPASNEDWWPRMVMLKVLAQYEEATGDARIIPFMLRYLHYMNDNLAQRPLRDWGQARAGEAILSAIWLYRRTGEAFIPELIEKLHSQSIDWAGIFNHFPYWCYQKRFDHRVHVVNVAMGLKEPALYGLLTNNEFYLGAAERGIHSLMQYHGQLNGTFSGDEWLAGTSPSQGTELCAVVEYMFTLEILYAIGGKSWMVDTLERLAFNALPAAISEDWMTHQYVQQVNQIACTSARRNWTENRDDANMFGLEPNFGCCTANMHQGWPKFTMNLWHKKSDAHYVVSSYTPYKVNVENNGYFIVDGDYPFKDRVTITYNGPDRLLTLQLRKPGWCEELMITVNREVICGQKDFTELCREFKNGDAIEIYLPMKPRIEHRANGAVGVFYGPLLFALPLDGRLHRRSGSMPFVDYEIFLNDPESWNYALRLDDNNLDDSVRVAPGCVLRQPFQAKEPPVKLLVQAAR